MVTVDDKTVRSWTYRVGGDVKKAGSTASPIKIASPEEVLLSMAGYLCWRPSFNVVP